MTELKLDISSRLSRASLRSEIRLLRDTVITVCVQKYLQFNVGLSLGNHSLKYYIKTSMWCPTELSLTSLFNHGWGPRGPEIRVFTSTTMLVWWRVKMMIIVILWWTNLTTYEGMMPHSFLCPFPNNHHLCVKYALKVRYLIIKKTMLFISGILSIELKSNELTSVEIGSFLVWCLNSYHYLTLKSYMLIIFPFD